MRKKSTPFSNNRKELDPQNSKIVKKTIVRIEPVGKLGKLTQKNPKRLENENPPDTEIMQELD